MGSLALSIADLGEHDACDLDDRIADLGRTLGRAVPEDERVPLRVWWDLTSTSVDNLWWSLRCLGEPGTRIGVEATCLAARRALSCVSESRRFVALTAIEAAEGWLRGEVTSAECRRPAADAFTVVAYAAHAAAYTAYTANAAYVAHAIADGRVAERAAQRADLYRLAFGPTTDTTPGDLP